MKIFRVVAVIKAILFLFLIGLVIAHFAEHQGSKPKPIVDPATKIAVALFTYDINSPPAIVDSRELRDWMDLHGVAYRFAGSTAKFGDDQPDFKKLMEQPRKADNWLYVHGGLLRSDDSVPLPADEKAAEKVIGKHAR